MLSVCIVFDINKKARSMSRQEAGIINTYVTANLSRNIEELPRKFCTSPINSTREY